MKIKEQVFQKIYEELQDFKKMEQEKDNLDYDNQKIFSQIYESLISSKEDVSDVLLKNLVNQSTNILESIYKDSVDNNGNFSAEIKPDIEKNCIDDLENEEDVGCNNPNFEQGGIL